MEDFGVLIVIGGIFMGLYYILKASALLLAARRAKQAQETAALQDTDPAEAFGVEDGSHSKDDRETQ